MRKIISLFQRNYDTDRLVRNELVPGAEWVAAGEGTATQKLDGTCCMVRGGKLYKRYEVKEGGTPPADFEAATELDENTGKIQGWVPVGDGPEDRWHREAWTNAMEEAKALNSVYGVDGAEEVFVVDPPLMDGTYELLGPKIQGNPENFKTHTLLPHGTIQLPDCPRDFDGLREYLRTHDIEGVVWHRGNGDMVKIKSRDFGLKRPTQTSGT